MDESFVIAGALAVAIGLGGWLIRRVGSSAAGSGRVGRGLTSLSAIAVGGALIVLSAVAGQDEHALSRSLGRDSAWYGRAVMAEDGNPAMQKRIGDQFYYGRSPFAHSYADAAEWYRRAARQGYAPAMLALAAQYEAGQGVDRNLPLAELWYRKAARGVVVSAMRAEAIETP